MISPLARVPRAHGSRQAHGVLDEPDRAVHERDVAAAGMVARRVHGAVPSSRASEGVRVIGRDVRAVGREDVGVDVPLPAIGVAPGEPLVIAPGLPVLEGARGEAIVDDDRQDRHVRRLDDGQVGVVQVPPAVVQQVALPVVDQRLAQRGGVRGAVEDARQGHIDVGRRRSGGRGRAEVDPLIHLGQRHDAGRGGRGARVGLSARSDDIPGVSGVGHVTQVPATRDVVVPDAVGRAEEGRDRRVIDGPARAGLGRDVGPLGRVREVQGVVHRGLLDVGQESAIPGQAAGGAGAGAVAAVAVFVQGSGGIDVDVVGHRQRDLLEVVGALRPSRGLSGGLDAGGADAIRTAMMAMTTNNSIKVKPRLREEDGLEG